MELEEDLILEETDQVKQDNEARYEWKADVT